MLRDPIELAVSAQGLALRQAACAADAPVRLAVVVNPRARRLARSGKRAALASQVSPELYVETRDLASLKRAIAYLVAECGANVLAIAGGDGSLHHAVNALFQLAQETQRNTGEMPPWPRVLILNGGTLNIVGRSVAIHGPPEETLRHFQRDFDRGPLSRVPVRPVPMLQVAWQNSAPQLGFVFGSALAYHALDLYSRFGAGYLGLSRFLLAFARGALVGSALWREESWKLGPYTGLSVDGRIWPTYGGVTAVTADLTLAIGAVRAIRRPLGAPGFAVRVVEETDPKRLVALIPSLMSERGGAGVADVAVAHRMELTGPYTLDGECFHEPVPHARLTVERFPTPLPVVPAQHA
jgi:hypothetical protein